MSMRGDLAYAADIFTEARLLQQISSRFTYDQFLADPITRRAVERCFITIGEATKKLSADFRAANPNLPWDWMARKRDLLAHRYHQVDYAVVWETMKADIPTVIQVLAPIVSPPDEELDLFK